MATVTIFTEASAKSIRPPPPLAPTPPQQQQFPPQQPGQPYPGQQYSAPPQQGGGPSKVACGLCGILIGSLGIHKFLLGNTGAGLTMLLVSLLTLGFGAIVMSIIGLIEGIIYLTKSDQEFYQIYVVQKKDWF